MAGPSPRELENLLCLYLPQERGAPACSNLPSIWPPQDLTLQWISRAPCSIDVSLFPSLVKETVPPKHTHQSHSSTDNFTTPSCLLNQISCLMPLWSDPGAISFSNLIAYTSSSHSQSLYYAEGNNRPTLIFWGREKGLTAHPFPLWGALSNSAFQIITSVHSYHAWAWYHTFESLEPYLTFSYMTLMGYWSFGSLRRRSQERRSVSFLEALIASLLELTKPSQFFLRRKVLLESFFFFSWIICYWTPTFPLLFHICTFAHKPSSKHFIISKLSRSCFLYIVLVYTRPQKVLDRYLLVPICLWYLLVPAVFGIPICIQLLYFFLIYGYSLNHF